MVYRLILKKITRAFYITCCSHTLNLVVVDSVKCSPKIAMFFNTINHVYNFFPASTKRWLTLQSKCPSLTVKPLSDTRWESHINAVRTLPFEMPKIYRALQDAARTANETTAKITAESVLLKFDFLCSIVI